MEYPSWWQSPVGEIKHFVVGPVPEGWTRCKGRYDFETGAWVGDEAPKKVKAVKKPRSKKVKKVALPAFLTVGPKAAK
jgi:hypothetical protein